MSAPVMKFRAMARVRVLAGEHAGKSGRIAHAFRRPVDPGFVAVELYGLPLGWSVAIPRKDIAFDPEGSR